MQPLAELPVSRLVAIRGVFTDLDDTLTTGGRLTAQAYEGLERLRDAGLLVVPVTGRPAGWCDHIARMWPVDAVVGENGALWYRYHPRARRMERRYMTPEDARARNEERLAVIASQILAKVPGTAVSADQAFRVTDLAIDVCEDVPPLPAPEVERIVMLMERAGLRAKASSIHVNGWFGDYDKLTTTRTMMQESFGVNLEQNRDAYLFVGDSPNDQPMFGFFPDSVGVANVREYTQRLERPPKFVTSRPAGAGFAELVDRLLDAKKGHPTARSG